MTRRATSMILLLTASAFIGLEGSVLPIWPRSHSPILPPWVKPTSGSSLQGDTRTSEDATSNLGTLVDSVTILVNNQNMIVPIAPPVPMAEAILSILEEMEEKFQLVTNATVTPQSSTEFKISVAGLLNFTDDDMDMEK